jgi:hypothetical protein
VRGRRCSGWGCSAIRRAGRRRSLRRAPQSRATPAARRSTGSRRRERADGSDP